jgi:hypothetical protein
MDRIHAATVMCVVNAYKEPVPILAIMDFCSDLRYPAWTREEVEQVGTRALNAIQAMDRPRLLSSRW